MARSAAREWGSWDSKRESLAGLGEPDGRRVLRDRSWSLKIECAEFLGFASLEYHPETDADLRFTAHHSRIGDWIYWKY